MRSRFYIFLYLMVHTILLLKPPGAQAENPEWMYFHDIKNPNNITALDNYIYLTTDNNYVIRISLENLEIDTITHIDYYVSCIAQDKGKNIWMSTKFSGIYKYYNGNLENFTPSNSGLPHHNVLSIAFDKEDNLWCATENGLAKFDGSAWKVFLTDGTGQYDNQFQEVKIDIDGTSWHRTFGLRVAHFKNGVFSGYDSTNTGIPSLSIPKQIEIDSKGTKWIISGNQYIEQFGGLSKYDGNEWTHYDKHNSDMTNHQLSTIAIDSNDVIWLGGYYNGLTKFDGTTWSNFNQSNSGISGEGVNSLCIDRFNNKWMVVYSEETVGLEVFREGGVLLPSNVEELFSKNDEIIPRLYPNPAREIITVSDIGMRPRKFTITNILGQEMLSGEFYHEINISKLIPGFYFLNVDEFNLKFMKIE